MQLKLVFWLIGILVVTPVFSQQDSVMLDAVTISASKFTKYSSGAKVIHLSSEDSLGNLNDMMAQLPSITFKNYGNYGLSSIALRGTSASHTQLNWNGIPVNSPTLGQADFSLFPAFMMDEIAVQFGSTSALTGSGAIGGAVSMDYSVPKFNKEIHASISLQAASFDHFFTGAKLSYGNNWGFGKTKIYRRSIANNFPYPEKGSGNIIIQKNAAVSSYGVEQQFHFKLADTQLLSLIGFHNFNHREIQPNIASTGNGETLQDDNTRVVVNYKNNSNIGFWDIKLAYVLNDQLYNNTNRIKSEQWSAMMDWDKNIGDKSAVRAGLNHHYFIPKTDNYVAAAKENRTEVYASIKQNVLPTWEVSLNLRQAIYDGVLAPFTPSLGQEFTLLLNNSKLLFKNRVGRGYRIPTLNDRFWVQGGNPNLLPEDSWSIEFGEQWIKRWKENAFSFEGTYYYQNVNDWIQWTPTTSIWHPENVQKVEINGIETEAKLNIKKQSHSFDFAANYSFITSLIKKDVDEIYVNNQLPYVAKHTANFKTLWKHKKWNNSFRVHFSGKRYIEKSNDEFQAIDGFTLLDYKLSKIFYWKKTNFQVGTEVNNILNIYYEQLKNHAMPGRNYAINLSINI